ncbi:NACHT%2C LRR and PYD domains-containing protein 1b allele 3-like [Xyrichtys novacula]|uniref:NACHT, LRR and PYD domains-containing protein 1b allele 3-like n=1 Tax=Xyrichtys novacula TaxID=13765 RepID=A0AAV1H8R3_XYRNO|nr:NACHT%2C LRR and PYD domains-containing protein 1b allele 3-like [Xyrichtys novacula]
MASAGEMDRTERRASCFSTATRRIRNVLSRICRDNSSSSQVYMNARSPVKSGSQPHPPSGLRNSVEEDSEAQFSDKGGGLQPLIDVSSSIKDSNHPEPSEDEHPNLRTKRSNSEDSPTERRRKWIHARSKSESGYLSDAQDLDEADTPVSWSVASPLLTCCQIQTCSSGCARNERVCGSLLRFNISRSLSHMTSAKDKTPTRAHSLPKLQLKSSFEQFTPNVTADEDHETYRFQSSCSGLYQCRVTGLLFLMEREGEVVYRTLSWDRRLLSQHHKQPAGPLFDIKCEQQSVCQLHLPHCEIRSTGGAEFLSVAHMDEEEGIEFIAPQKITETHVVINISGVSAFGNVKDEDSPPDPVQALVLLFYRPPSNPDPTSLLNVMVLPRNVAFRDVLRYRKKLDGEECYIETSPHCKLIPQQEYSLSICPEDDSVLVEPTTAEFDSDNYDNYFPSFQVFLERTLKHMKLVLRDTNSSHSVWERRVCLSSSGVLRSCGQSALNLPLDQRLFDIRSSFIEGVSGPVLQTLLDKLSEKTVMTDCERESADELRNRREKARFVIDTVRKKGEAASSEMIEALCELDPFLCEHLDLN